MNSKRTPIPRMGILSGIPRRKYRSDHGSLENTWSARIICRLRGRRFSCILSEAQGLFRIVIVKTVSVATPLRGRHYGRVTRDFITVTQSLAYCALCISRVMQMQAPVLRSFTAEICINPEREFWKTDFALAPFSLSFSL